MARRVNITIPNDIERDVLALIKERGDDPKAFGVFSKALIDYVRLAHFTRSAPAVSAADNVQPTTDQDDDFGFVKE